MRKIHIVGNALHYANWMEGKHTNVMEEADLVVFTGGEDVTPLFYNENPHPTTMCNIHRDNKEEGVFYKACALGKHILGICRGSQFVCVMNGGKLVQHQPNPKYIHPITMANGAVIDITSTHHQAAYPFNLPEEDYQVLGWTTGMLKFHENGNEEEMHPPKECEIVYYPLTKSLGIQGHPEMMWMEKDKYTETFKYLHQILINFLNNKL